MLALQESIDPDTAGRWFHWMMEEAPTGAVLGNVTPCVESDDVLQAEIGFTVAREHQGRGFAGEAVRAVLGWAFGGLGLHRVVAITDARNDGAAALL